MAANRFLFGYEEALRSYLRGLGEDPSELVVAVARKAPRLLQLIGSNENMPPLPAKVYITDKAAPFIPLNRWRGSRVLLTDDTVIYGATFWRVRRDLETVGVELSSHVLALSETARPEVARRLDRVALIASEQAVRTLIDLEIQSFGALGLPYDIDHPIVTRQLDGQPPLAAGRFAQQLPTAVETTRDWQREHGLRAFTLGIGEEIRSTHSQRWRQLGPCKVRVFFDSKRGRATIVPIYCLGVREPELHDPMLFAGAPEGLTEAWQTLLSGCRAAGWGRRAQTQALAQAAHYLASFELMLRWSAIEAERIAPLAPDLDPFDLTLLFGPDLARTLAEDLQVVLQRDWGASRLPNSKLPVMGSDRFDPEREIDALLERSRGRELDGALDEYLTLADHDVPDDLAHALFNAQRRFFDLARAKDEDLRGERLAKSLIPLAAVRALLARHGAAIGAEDFDRWCDIAIDAGSIVPHYHPTAADPALWVRSVRAGERRMEKLRYWVHTCLTEIADATQVWHPDSEHVGASWFVTEKALATLVGAMQREIRLELRRNVVVGFDQYGARSQLPELPRAPYLLQWAMNAGIAHRERGQARRGSGAAASGEFVSPSPGFDERFPPSGNTLEPQFRVTVGNVLGCFVAIEASLRGEQRLRAILALSTCGDDRRYIEALRTEADVWLNHSEFGASILAARIRDVADGREIPNLQARLRESATAIRQGAVKQQAYERRLAIRDYFDGEFKTNPGLHPYSDAWSAYLRNLIQTEESSSVRYRRLLEWVLALARSATALTRATLETHQVIRAEARGAIPLEASVSALNRLISDGREEFSRRSIMAVDLADLQAPRPALRRIALMLDQVVGLTEDAWFDGLDESPLHLWPEDVAVLMWDLRGSASQLDSHALGSAIAFANDRIAVAVDEVCGYGFNQLQDDGNAVVLKSVDDAIHVFNVLWQAFAEKGLAVRGAVGTTVGSQRIEMNEDSSEFHGQIFPVTARYRDALREISDDRARATEHKVEIAEDVSYLMIPSGALEVLHEHERIGTERLAGFDSAGVIRGYRPRVASTLSTDLVCYVPCEFGCRPPLPDPDG